MHQSITTALFLATAAALAAGCQYQGRTSVSRYVELAAPARLGDASPTLEEISERVGPPVDRWVSSDLPEVLDSDANPGSAPPGLVFYGSTTITRHAVVLPSEFEATPGDLGLLVFTMPPLIVLLPGVYAGLAVRSVLADAGAGRPQRDCYVLFTGPSQRPVAMAFAELDIEQTGTLAPALTDLSSLKWRAMTRDSTDFSLVCLNLRIPGSLVHDQLYTTPTR